MLLWGRVAGFRPRGLPQFPWLAFAAFAGLAELRSRFTGKEPYQAETPMALLLKHINEPMPPLSNYRRDIPERVEGVIAKATAKDPNNRYSSAGEMAADFSANSIRRCSIIYTGTGKATRSILGQAMARWQSGLRKSSLALMCWASICGVSHGNIQKASARKTHGSKVKTSMSNFSRAALPHCPHPTRRSMLL